jgi:hypothetical protein
VCSSDLRKPIARYMIGSIINETPRYSESEVRATCGLTALETLR